MDNEGKSCEPEVVVSCSSQYCFKIRAASTLEIPAREYKLIQFYSTSNSEGFNHSVIPLLHGAWLALQMKRTIFSDYSQEGREIAQW